MLNVLKQLRDKWLQKYDAEVIKDNWQNQWTMVMFIDDLDEIIANHYEEDKMRYTYHSKESIIDCMRWSGLSEDEIKQCNIKSCYYDELEKKYISIEEYQTKTYDLQTTQSTTATTVIKSSKSEIQQDTPFPDSPPPPVEP